MKQATTPIEDLGQLTELDASKRRLKPGTAEFEKLTLECNRVRERLPAAILHHYDIRESKGRRGAAKMRNKVCGGCYISLPSGQLADLFKVDAELQICGNCSIFVLPGDSPPPAEAIEPVTKPAPRKRKVKSSEASSTEEAG